MFNFENNMDFNTDKIEAYWLNQLSHEEIQQLLYECEKDPSLKSELMLQKEIIVALQNHRKQALKQRLDNIVIPTQNYTYHYLAALFSITLITIIWGSSQFSKTSYSNTNINKVALAHIKSETHQIVTNNITNDLNVTTSVVAEEEEVVNNTTMYNNNQINQQQIAKIEQQNTFANTKTQNTTYTGVKVVLPTQILENDNKDDHSGDITVGHDAEKEEKILYQFYNDQLFLNINPEGAREQLIILENEHGKEYYLYYKKNYYQINIHQVEPQEPEIITDKILIEELNKARNK
ncbi:MAG: hypothetical protein EAZ55_05390 [Cytophagales bacterium]|nr:MAG: hypothetical protein EAZ55_05390 [Cytophagales bacterium]